MFPALIATPKSLTMQWFMPDLDASRKKPQIATKKALQARRAFSIDSLTPQDWI
jgi:hypothetical protein